MKHQIIREEWGRAFPQLTELSNGKLYKIIGPLVIGIELTALRAIDQYRPHLVVYGLWEKIPMQTPVLLFQFYYPNGRQIDLSYTANRMPLSEIFNIVNRQIPISLDCDIDLAEVFLLIDAYANRSTLKASYNSYLQAKLVEGKFNIALYVDTNEALGVLEEIKLRNWDEAHFKLWDDYVVDWLRRLEVRAEHRNRFILQIENNTNDKRFQCLKKSILRA